VNGTPAFFINGRILSGAQPYDAFKKIIDEELELKKK
jgi:protein-disulfide isomerase